MAIIFPWQDCWQGLEAVIPIYEPGTGANYTCIFCDGEHLVYPKRVWRARRELLEAFALDLRQARIIYSRRTGTLRNFPLPVKPGLTLIPVWFRLPLNKENGSTAYIVAEKINRVVPARNMDPPPGLAFFGPLGRHPASYLQLTSGKLVPSLNTFPKLIERRHAAAQAAETYLDNLFPERRWELEPT